MISFSIWPIIKIFIIIFLSIYIIFALVVVRQVQLMTKTLQVGFEGQLKFLSIMHLMAAVGVLIFAILIL